jgi:hypothetical protein
MMMHNARQMVKMRPMNYDRESKEEQMPNSPKEPPETIAQVFAQFQAEFIENLDETARHKYALIIGLFTQCLNEFAFQDLDLEDSRRFETAQEAGGESRNFVDLFGPDKLPESLSTFLEWRLLRNIADDENVADGAGAVIVDLFNWLGEKKYLGKADIEACMKISAEAAGNLLNAPARPRIV